MPPSAPKPPSDDAAMRKKKNADAQAAFRARRANYIATLEEAGRHVRVFSGLRAG